MSKVAKGKGTSRSKSGKTGTCSEEQDNEPTCSFQNYDSRRLFMFLYQGWYLHKGKETSYLTSSVANFGQKATSLFEIWTPAQSSASTSRFHKGFFPFLDRMVLFLSSFRLFLFLFVFVFVFFTKDFLPPLVFL